MTPKQISNNDLKLAFQTACLGEIYPAIVAIAFDYVDKKLTTRMYLDREPNEKDYDHISCIVAEVTSAFSYLLFDKLEDECIFLDDKNWRKHESVYSLVYARKENNAP